MYATFFVLEVSVLEDPAQSEVTPEEKAIHSCFYGFYAHQSVLASIPSCELEDLDYVGA